ncbi:MAG: hypothetical protein GY725_12410 [bacterium]|nr:hypothetical protein [bacterium]
MIVRVLVVLIMVVPMLGGLNYVRNEPLDQDLKERRYATISDTDLEALQQAYEAQLGYAKSQVEDVPEGTGLVERYGASDVGGKAEGFAKFQQRNTAWRQQRGRAMEEQATLKEIQREKSIRKRGLHTQFGRILRRVTAL